MKRWRTTVQLENGKRWHANRCLKVTSPNQSEASEVWKSKANWTWPVSQNSEQGVNIRSPQLRRSGRIRRPPDRYVCQ